MRRKGRPDEMGKMSWTTPDELRAQVQKMWERGDILSAYVTGEAFFPRRLVLKCPTSAEMLDHFDAVRDWIFELGNASHIRVETREFKHRVLGSNAVPHEAWIDTFDDALALIGKRRDASRLATLLETTRKSQPKLLDWLKKRPLRALALYEEWRKLLEIVAWLEAHPRPGIYLRQVDIPGVHSKFIETHRNVLAELLDYVLPPEAVDSSATGVSQFARRYGFRDKAARIRFRFLDRKLQFLPGVHDQDITLDAESFSRLKLDVTQIFITENEINFLSFPDVDRSLVIFGAGYGFEMLDPARWLLNCRILYWGDIDTHGFAILDQLRARFTHVESFLMNRATLLAFESQWGEEEQQTLKELNRLNNEEQALYDDLRDNKIRKNLRLEQERIGFSWVEAALLPYKQ
jgi:hypothetical protein